jgi:uncharacterized protein
MYFGISDRHIDPYLLVGVGFVIGIFGGFFGVGGSFLAGPALRAFGLPWNFAVGTDLAHIVGKSIVAARKHRMLGNVDLKLGLIMTGGTIGGVEAGAQLIEFLKHKGGSDLVNLVVSVVSIAVYFSISGFMTWEAWRTMKLRGKGKKRKASRGKSVGVLGAGRDESAFTYVKEKVHRFHLWPVVNLPVSGVARISVWSILVVSFIGGVFSGFLGGGAGYIRMPLMVYVLGVPTHVAVGTDLFEIVISASYGTLSHAMKGNVDILIALVMHTGAAVGAQIGAISTQYFAGPKIRLAFVPLPLIGAAIVIYTLITGQKV